MAGYYIPDGDRTSIVTCWVIGMGSAALDGLGAEERERKDACEGGLRHSARVPRLRSRITDTTAWATWECFETQSHRPPPCHASKLMQCVGSAAADRTAQPVATPVLFRPPRPAARRLAMPALLSIWPHHDAHPAPPPAQ